MQQALGQLPHDLREALLLVVVGELTHQEAADLLEVPLGTVLSRVSRAENGCENASWPPSKRISRRLTLSAMESPDPKLDARLRAVPLPEGLIQRLRQVALADDDGLDAALTELPLPAGLVARLRAIPMAADEDLDQTLRDVPVPAGLARGCEAFPGRTTRGSTRRMAR